MNSRRQTIFALLATLSSIFLLINYMLSCSSESIYSDSDDDDTYTGDDDTTGDDDDTTEEELDRDGDGYTEGEGDCDDYNPGVYPGAEEVCDSGIDEDCDGLDEECPCTPYEPLYVPGMKLYDVTSSQFSSPGTLELTFTGVETAEGYEVENWYNFVTDYISGVMYVACDSSGVSMVRWEESVYMGDWGLSLNLSGEDIPPRTYLTADPSPGDSWNYNYTLNIIDSSGMFTTSGDVSGTYNVNDFESISTPAGTFRALKVTNSYTMAIDLMGSPTTITGTIIDWYVENLGVVKTEHSSSQGELESKVLTSYSGFNP